MNGKGLGQFTRFSMSTLLTHFLLFLFSGVTSIITARVLGPAGKGQLTLILLIPFIATTLGKLGIGHAINYYSNKLDHKLLIYNSLLLFCICGVLLTFIALSCVYLLREAFFRTVDNCLLVTICLSTPFYLIYYQQVSILQAFYKIDHRNLLLISKSILNISLLILFIVIFKFYVAGGTAAAILSLTLPVLLVLYLFSREIKRDHMKIDWGIIRKLLSYGFKTHLGIILKDLTYRSDLLLISYYLPPKYVGHYTISVMVAETLLRIPDAISTVLLPRIVNMNEDLAKSFTPTVCRIVLIPILSTCAIIVFLRKQIIVMAFGNEYLPSASALMLLIPGIIALSIWKILANDLIGQGYPVKYSVTSIIAFLTMIVLDIILIPLYGTEGAAIASSCSYLLASITIIVSYRKITGISILYLLIPTRRDLRYCLRIVSYLGGAKVAG